jgi:ribosome modulation factor
MDPNSNAIDEGFDAFLAGVPRSACPYQDWSLEYFQWLVGWDQAEEADLSTKPALISRAAADGSQKRA